jgi:hypothetical protein
VIQILHLVLLKKTNRIASPYAAGLPASSGHGLRAQFIEQLTLFSPGQIFQTIK